MNISGIVVHAHPDKVDKVRTQLEDIPGVEIHAVGADGKMVVTIEKDGDREVVDVFETIAKLSGVLSTGMVYHHFEPDNTETA